MTPLKVWFENVSDAVEVSFDFRLSSKDDYQTFHGVDIARKYCDNEKQHMRYFPAQARATVGLRCIAFLFVASLFFSISLHGAFAQQNIGVGTQAAGWEPNAEVTEVGKAAARAEDFLDWTLKPDNATWIFLTPDTSVNQIAVFWSHIRNIAYVLTVAIVLFTALLIIITRGRSINARRQILVVGAVFVLITFSFSLIDFLYRLVDTLQGFFLRLPGTPISSQNLLHVGFDYKDFTGLRQSDSTNNEAAHVALFLIKATAVTYYVMAGILLLRKIILWFFIILSPLWVLLLPFPLIRNTAKVWMGEFFRWLFYGPLFALLLAGLVEMWQKFNIPLNFSTVRGAGQAGPIEYPTAVSVLLGGPGEIVSQANSLNNVDTYAKYVVALLMLWVVILLPFLLLKIFRDVLGVVFKEESPFFERAFGALYPFLGRAQVPTPPPVSPGEGRARELSLRRPAEVAREVGVQTQITDFNALPQVKTTDIVSYAGLSIPRLSDLPRLEMQRDAISQHQLMLRNIANPTSIPGTHERSRFSSIQQELLSRSKRGDVAASTILAAAESARSGRPVPIIVGTRAIGTKPTIPLTAAKPQLIPTVNRMQTVGIDEYEEVKKMWESNYKEGEVPISDKIKSRQDWITGDIAKIANVIELLASSDEQKKKGGLGELSVILPFLLLGGFSEQETTVYLKAKLEAAKKALSDIEQQVKEQDKVFVEQKKEEVKQEKTMETRAPVPTNENPPTETIERKEV